MILVAAGSSEHGPAQLPHSLVASRERALGGGHVCCREGSLQETSIRPFPRGVSPRVAPCARQLLSGPAAHRCHPEDQAFQHLDPWGQARWLGPRQRPPRLRSPAGSLVCSFFGESRVSVGGGREAGRPGLTLR